MAVPKNRTDLIIMIRKEEFTENRKIITETQDILNRL